MIDEGHEVRYEDGYMRGSDARIEWERREDFCFCSFEGTIFESGTLAQMGCSSVAQKYMVIKGEPNAFIRMKKGAGGVTIKKTTQALVFFMSTNDCDQCNIVVERFGDYLIDTWL
ncbi:hypothetical protein Bca52824_088324 [Brassica carinata]|uniref:Profilin n=2 Tax=Brassica TaxID=3705 RepID=A0A8X7PB78_BRACI|nr:hypothetical protein Bca52824_088324 [Brassica carinata]